MSQESRPAATAGRLQPADGLSVNRLGYGAVQPMMTFVIAALAPTVHQ
ncbi:hypothetical protein ACU635_31570 [[Actinomadura] parvosata]|uniref:MFS transporter n=1 Tax=Nonomuraea composti TaxID=2720023 RepID=A0ABX1B3D3_9ACTN|nr:hypothetical protein [Nonomuraea sp. FMUSA5-5]NJP90987.1 hypothetical protein [Nonomuraea sp. FMUSA5-5]